MKKIIKLSESDLTKMVAKIINEIREENPYEQLRNYLENNVDFEGYNLKNKYKNKLTQLFEIFLDEYGFAIEKYGHKKALIEWLKGLPSSIDIPYDYYDISNLLYALGFDEVKNMEDDEIGNFYYSIVADTILKNK